MVQAGAVCYPTNEAAALAVGSAQVGQNWDGSLVVSVSYVADKLQYLMQDATGQTSVREIPVSFPACQLLDYGDAFQLSWAVVAVWAVAWGVKALTRVVHGSGYGDA